MRLALFRNRSFLAGVVVAITFLFAARWFINETTLSDRLVGPLLLADSPNAGDAIVVLGGGTIGDCVPNLNSMRRVVLAARLFRQGRAPLLAITGGSTDGSCPVADAMMHLAGELGVPDDKLIIERQSRNTHENAERTAPLLLAEGVKRVVLVTDRLHMRRAIGVFEHHGFAVEPVSVPVYEGHPDNVSMLAAGAREAAALSYYNARGWMGPRLNQPADPGAVGPEARPQYRGAIAHAIGPMVLLGASYAGNWKLNSADGIPIANAGIAGNRTADLIGRFDRDVVEQQPRAVLMWGFINDLFGSDNLEQASASVRGAYTEMIARSRAAGIEPILATEITVRRHEGVVDRIRSAAGSILGRISNEERINRYVMDLNRWLGETARREGLLLLDFQGALADDSGRRRIEFATEDGSHVTPAGYEALTQYVRPILARHFSAGRQPGTVTVP